MEARLGGLLAAALDGILTDVQAEELAAVDHELGKLAWLAAGQRIAELKAKAEGPAKVDPNTPSGQRPVYAKPPAPRRKGKPGWQRLAEVLVLWYEQIGLDVKAAAVPYDNNLAERMIRPAVILRKNCQSNRSEGAGRAGRAEERVSDAHTAGT